MTLRPELREAAKGAESKRGRQGNTNAQCPLARLKNRKEMKCNGVGLE